MKLTKHPTATHHTHTYTEAARNMESLASGKSPQIALRLLAQAQGLYEKLSDLEGQARCGQKVAYYFSKLSE